MLKYILWEEDKDMDIDKASHTLGKLEPGERKVMYTSPKGIQVTATQTGKFSPRDYAVGLVIPGRSEFYPTHVRLLLDYYLKRLSDPGRHKSYSRLWKEYMRGMLQRN